MVKKLALITGITGQDGSYLAELLLDKDYEVHGLIRRSSTFNTSRIEHIFDKLQLHYGDLSDGSNLSRIVSSIRPDEIYNLGAMSHVKVSFDSPEYTADITGVGTLRLLEAVRSAGLAKTCRIYHASTSELFGLIQEARQKETTPFYPRSPYGCAKLYAHWIVKNYREAYGMFCVSGILFNHESPRRGRTFVTRKITVAAANIKIGKQEMVSLGNLDAKRDWGHAKDYVRAMWMMLQTDTPEDYVVGIGEQHTVREFCEITFSMLGMPVRWEGTGLNEKGFDSLTGKLIIAVDANYFRPTEVDSLLSDPTKVREKLGWVPEYDFQTLVKEMVVSDAEKLGVKVGDQNAAPKPF